MALLDSGRQQGSAAAQGSRSGSAACFEYLHHPGTNTLQSPI